MERVRIGADVVGAVGLEDIRCWPVDGPARAGANCFWATRSGCEVGGNEGWLAGNWAVGQTADPPGLALRLVFYLESEARAG